MKIYIKSAQIIILLLVLSLFTIISCKKEQNQNGTDEQQQREASTVSSEAEAEAGNIFSRVFDDVMGVNTDVGIGGTGVFYGKGDTLTPVPHCFTVTIEHPNGTPFPVRITIDFGTTGCTGPDGHTRKGKIITEYTQRLMVPGAMAVTTFDGFYFDDIKVEGIHKITNISTLNTTPLNRKFKVEVIDGKLIKSNGNYIKWNSVKFIIQFEGIGTLNPLDDAFRIEGSSSGQALRGNLLVAWQSTITEPLIKRFTCRWIVRGRVKTVRISSNTTNLWEAILDFGNGDCDNKATLTINGVTHQITLP